MVFLTIKSCLLVIYSSKIATFYRTIGYFKTKCRCLDSILDHFFSNFILQPRKNLDSRSSHLSSKSYFFTKVVMIVHLYTEATWNTRWNAKHSKVEITIMSLHWIFTTYDFLSSRQVTQRTKHVATKLSACDLWVMHQWIFATNRSNIFLSNRRAAYKMLPSKSVCGYIYM